MSLLSINRRNFLKLSAAAGTGLAMSAPAFAAPQSPAAIPVRALGKTGLQLPILSMGVMRADNPNLLKAAYDAGIKFFDTANSYQSGRNETMLGEFFKDKPRDSFVVASKANLGRDLDNDATISAFLSSFETSLKRLQLEFIDIYYVHSGSVQAAQHPKVLEMLDNLKKSGKVKWVGISTHNQEPAVINAMVDAKVWDVVLTSYNFKQIHHAELIPALKRAHEAGMGIVAMKTMAGGAFLDRERTQPNNVKAALKWALQPEYIHTSIPGFVNFEELEACVVASSDIEFNNEEKQFMSTIAVASALPNDLYCQQCGKCVAQCPQHLPIPDMMRAYMYTYGYHFPAMAQETLASLHLPDNICSSCGECSVQCTAGFNVAFKLQDINRLQKVPAEFLA